jgi:hypothetical protein
MMVAQLLKGTDAGRGVNQFGIRNSRRFQAKLLLLSVLFSLATTMWAASKRITNMGHVVASGFDSNSRPKFARNDEHSPPTVTIESPKMDALFVGPATITIEAVATDRDGIISQVEFLDNGESIGSGTSTDGKRFVITEQNVSLGTHSLLAIATDNEGLKATSNAANVFVNGSAIVSISGPQEGSLVTPGSDLTITAFASDPSGIVKVQFFFSEQFIGDGNPVEANKYSLVLKDVRRAAYKIDAVATNSGGFKSISIPVRFTVSIRPVVNIVSPAKVSGFVARTNLSITARANQPGGEVEKIDFYANGKLIGTANDIGTEQFFLTWRNVQNGTYLLTAVATDELGVTGKSQPVRIIVKKKGRLQ